MTDAEIYFRINYLKQKYGSYQQSDLEIYLNDLDEIEFLEDKLTENDI